MKREVNIINWAYSKTEIKGQANLSKLAALHI